MALAGEACILCQKGIPALLLKDADRSLKSCKECGVAYLWPHRTLEQEESYFAESYITSEEEVDVRFGSQQRKSLHSVANFIKSKKKNGKILDIGCAGGHFLDWFFPKTEWEKYGVELSRFAAARARQKELQVHNGPLQAAPLATSSFDVITVLDTFYYFADPISELQRIRKLLKPDGLLVMVLVNATGHIWRHTGLVSQVLGGSSEALLQSSHLYFYNPKSISFVLQKSDFELQAIKSWPATGQKKKTRQALFNAYHLSASLIWKLSASQVMLAPRFLVSAVPNQD